MRSIVQSLNSRSDYENSIFQTKMLHQLSTLYITNKYFNFTDTNTYSGISTIVNIRTYFLIIILNQIFVWQHVIIRIKIQNTKSCFYMCCAVDDKGTR